MSEFLEFLKPLPLDKAMELEPEQLAGYMLEFLNRYAVDRGHQAAADYFTGENFIASMLGQGSGAASGWRCGAVVAAQQAGFDEGLRHLRRHHELLA